MERHGDRHSLTEMLRKPPGPVLTTVVIAVCAMELVESWNLGGDLRMDSALLALGSAILFLVWLVRIGIAYRHLQKTWTCILRVLICPVLLLGSFALVAGRVPMQVRFKLSEPSLNAYLRTLRHLPVGPLCEPSHFKKRRVGLFTVRCADRPVADAVTITLAQDPLTPTSHEWYLVWEQTPPDPPAQYPLSSHWLLVLED